MTKCNKEAGFTLIETLLSLLAFMVMSSLILQMMIIVTPSYSKVQSLNEMEWELFLLNIKREMKMSSSVHITNHTLQYVVNEQVISIEPYQNLLRRKVNNQGHEVMLHKVGDFRVHQEGIFIVMKVRDQSGQLYSEKVPLSYMNKGG